MSSSEAALLLDELLAFTDEHIAVMTAEECEQYERLMRLAVANYVREVDHDWEQWLRLLFPQLFSVGFAPHHRQIWQWVWSIALGVPPDEVLVAALSRGGAKSTTAEAAVAAVGARRTRRYVLYVCDLQRLADDHVQNIGAMLESPYFRMAYPEVGTPRITAEGQKTGWSRRRLRTASKFTVEGYGLNTSVRGLKDLEQRPDMIVLDEFDAQDDSPGRIEEKIEMITEGLLPVGDPGNLAVLVIQNFPNRNGIMPRLCGMLPDQPAEFLQPRRVIGPIPALEDFAYEQNDDGSYRIVSGTPTWEGQDLEVCQAQVNLWGITAFRKEALFDLDAGASGMFAHVVFNHCTLEEFEAAREAATSVRVAVWCDPAVTDNDHSDSQGVIADALVDGTLYRLRCWEQRSTPVTAIKVAIAFAIRFEHRTVGIETDQGGDTWESVYREALAAVQADLDAMVAGEPVDGPDIYVQTLTEIIDRNLTDWPMYEYNDQEKAGSSQQSKNSRAQQMLGQVYEATTTKVLHVLGTHTVLERALGRFGKTKPFDLCDAAYWSVYDLDLLRKPVETSKSRARRRMPKPQTAGRLARVPAVTVR